LTSTRQPSSSPEPRAGQSRRHAPKLAVDPAQPNGWLREEERQSDGRRLPTLTVFLAGAECPFDCVFCDLWRQTLDNPTPRGAIPRQIATGLAAARPPTAGAIKLYNASNFFDPIAVPPEDDQSIAALLRPFDRVIVESHPRFIQRRCLEFADRLRGSLEVAIGLETADPNVLARLNKQMTLDMVADAAAALRTAGVGVRFFLLVPPPFVTAANAVAATERAVRYAAGLGADHVSLIPFRTEQIRAGTLSPQNLTRPTLGMVEDVLDACLDTAGVVVSVDLWNIERLAGCDHCGPARIDRLRAINLTGRRAARIPCHTCAS
jgi:radical SAM enzyme (TIGR01210 family)